MERVIPLACIDALVIRAELVHGRVLVARDSRNLGLDALAVRARFLHAACGCGRAYRVRQSIFRACVSCERRVASCRSFVFGIGRSKRTSPSVKTHSPSGQWKCSLLFIKLSYKGEERGMYDATRSGSEAATGSGASAGAAIASASPCAKHAGDARAKASARIVTAFLIIAIFALVVFVPVSVVTVVARKSTTVSRKLMRNAPYDHRSLPARDVDAFFSDVLPKAGDQKVFGRGGGGRE